MTVCRSLQFRLLLLLTGLVVAVTAQWDPNVLPERQVITHLFEWKYSDIAEECGRFLGPKGYGGVQVSPPHECVVAMTPDVQRPWWERYQPVSYEISSRSGSEEQFKDMVRRCNEAGVRIYVDSVINHMTGYWPQGTQTTGSSSFDAGDESYSGVPYSKLDFNDNLCHTSSGNIENYGDPEQVRNCKLSGLNDLALGDTYVSDHITAYLNKLLGWGVAGFRVDASKHMWPADLEIVYKGLINLSTDYFSAGSNAFIYQEVIDLGGEPITSSDYVGLGRVTEFKYGMFLGEAFRGGKELKWFSNFGEDWGMINSHESLVFIDNHDNQRGGGSDQTLTFRNPKWYKMATAFMLGWPYGFSRVMSSYDWDQKFVDGHDEHNWYGPPHDEAYNIVSPTINADDTCGGGWVCEHRWREIYNMVHFRNVAHGTDQNDWWDNGSNQIAFCRGNKAFLAINNDGFDLNETLQTCLPEGKYCDVISGSLVDGTCTGQTIDVFADGTAFVSIPTSADDGVIAIHAESRI